MNFCFAYPQLIDNLKFNNPYSSQVSEVYTKELKGAISALASLQGHLLIASGPKIILHKWTGLELNGVAFFDVPPLYVVSLNIVRAPFCMPNLLSFINLWSDEHCCCMKIFSSQVTAFQI